MSKLYLLCTLACLVIFLWFYLTDVKKSLTQSIMILIMALSGLGYYFISVSTELGEAVIGNKIKYLSGCFLPMLYLFTICEVCHIELKRVYKVAMIVFQFILYSFICTIGYNDLYYKNIQFVVQNGTGTLLKDYGPLHFLYPLTLYTYFGVSIVLTIVSAIKKKVVNLKEMGMMAIFAALAGLSYLIPKILHIETDFTALTTLIFLLGDLIPIYHSNLFTVQENTNIVEEQLAKVGFITFNRKLEYMGCNEYASNLFPELIDCKVGKRIENYGEDLKEIIEGIKYYDEKQSGKRKQGHIHIKFIEFNIDNHWYESEIHSVNNFNNKCVGYTVEFTDETEHYRVMELTNRYNEELSREVDKKTRRIREIQEKTILGMAQMVESRDLSTGGHVKRTSDVVRIFADKLLQSGIGVDKNFLELVIRSAPMHDLGKIGVDDAILRKKGKFNDSEYAEMKKHAEIGGDMVKDILTGVEEDEFVRIAQNVAHYHHERVNGEGYPEHLKNDEIPLEAKIMALADVFDALVSERCYKKAFSYDEAFAIVQKDAGSHFDSKLAEIFLTCRNDLEKYYNNYIE